MSQRKAVTKATATRYRSASKGAKVVILDELCATTGWHRDHARKALRGALGPHRVLVPRKARPPTYGEDVMVALRTVWAVMDAPAGKRMAPFLPEMVGRLRAFGELDLDDATAARLCGMSAATIDRRLAGERRRLQLKGRSGTKPGSLLKSQISIRTWADWDEQAPGFVEIDLVGHEGGDARGEFAQTITVTDVFTGWTETKAVRNKAQKWVFAALVELRGGFPFPIRGIDSDNGSEFINDHLLRYCEQEKITFTRSRAGNKNDGCHVEGEELVGGAPRGRLPPLRHQHRAGVAQHHLRSVAAPDQLLLTPAETAGETPPGREGDQEVRQGQDPLPAGRRRQTRPPGRQGRPCRAVRPAEPGTDPPRPPGPARPAPGTRQGQAPTNPTTGQTTTAHAGIHS